MEWKGVEGIYLVQSRDKRRAVFTMVMYLQFSQNTAYVEIT